MIVPERKNEAISMIICVGIYTRNQKRYQRVDEKNSMITKATEEKRIHPRSPAIMILAISDARATVPKWKIITGRLPSVAQNVTESMEVITFGRDSLWQRAAIFLWKRSMPSVALKESQNPGSYIGLRGLMIVSMRRASQRRALLEDFDPYSVII